MKLQDGTLNCRTMRAVAAMTDPVQRAKYVEVLAALDCSVSEAAPHNIATAIGEFDPDMVCVDAADQYGANPHLTFAGLCSLDRVPCVVVTILFLPGEIDFPWLTLRLYRRFVGRLAVVPLRRDLDGACVQNQLRRLLYD